MAKLYFVVGMEGDSDCGYLTADGELAKGFSTGHAFTNHLMTEDIAKAEKAAAAWESAKPRKQTKIEKFYKRNVPARKARVGYAVTK